jgi:hypothetical protein
MTAQRRTNAEARALGDDVRRKANGTAGSTTPRQFTLTPFEAVKLGTDPVHLIRGLIPREGLVVVWGPPKCGKSFWMFDTAMHIALGWEYRSRRTRQGAVVYLALEGGHGFRARIEAFRQRRGVTAAPFYLITDAMNLVADHAALVACVMSRAVSPALVIVDTLNRSLAGSESKDEDMAAYVRSADAIRDAFRCAVAIVHHCGVDERRPRGHTSLTGAADAQLAVKRDAAGNIIVTVEWMKDGPEGDTVVSRLDPVTVGRDSDGDDIASCVIEPAEGAAAEPPRRRMSDRQRRAMDALTNYAADHGKPPPATFKLPGGLLAVAKDDWREELFRRGVIDRDAANPRQDFRRLADSLAARQLIGERDGLVWSAST